MSLGDKIIVGMSGGVDSSVTAALMKDQGYNVSGLFMKNWEEDDAIECNSKKDYQDAKYVCKKLGIKLFSINFSDIYWDLVFKKFIDKLKSGLTPNPDILCNKEIKFNYFLKYALSLGCDKIATGHYAKIKKIRDIFTLNIPKDKTKDQTYFLYILKQKSMKKILFPLENIEKIDVKNYAKSLNIKIYDKKESMGICFIGKRNFSKFINKYIDNSPGIISDIKGNELGKHNGLFNYTIGQRKGIKIGGQKNYLDKPWFVIKKDTKKNILLVSQNENQLLHKGKISLVSVNWINKIPFKEKLKCLIRFRHGGKLISGEICHKKNLFELKLNQYERAITPGQSAVFYKGNECIGGGIVKKLCLQNI